MLLEAMQHADRAQLLTRKASAALLWVESFERPAGPQVAPDAALDALRRSFDRSNGVRP